MLNMKLGTQICRFGFIGIVGFLVDAGLLSFLIGVVKWGLYESRAISFSLAVTTTWYLNRHFTFLDRVDTNKVQEYGRYVSGQIVGGLINLTVYVAVLKMMPILAGYPVIPLAIGSLVALIFNFVFARYVAFSKSISNINGFSYDHERS